MSAIVLVLSRRAAADRAAVERGLAASPHRGTTTAVRVVGSTAVGVSQGEGPQRATIHEGDGRITAVAGRIDNLEEIAKGLGDDAASIGDETPASVVHRAFGKRGETVVRDLRGAFEAVVAEGERV